ncbi:MAG: M23 family metallopeptidase [Dehalococcoidia bacterium]|nr:M23 family metallopeptidase [Dehalococcoidia bacterium]
MRCEDATRQGVYGPKYREKRSGDRKLAPFALLAGVPVLAFLAWIGACAFGGGGAGEAPAEGRRGETLTKATESPKIAPTRDPANKVAGENEGAGTVASNPAKPDIKEYLIAGGKRFELPLNTHAGVEDYFGTPRADNKVHTGVDFSLVGLKNVPVESACSGFVIEAGVDEVYGTHVIIDCGGDFKVVLGWLESLRVTDGNNVSKSTVVGTGEPDGFVHFEIRYKDVPFDPKEFVQIPGKEIVPWTPTPTPTLRPGETPTPEPTGTRSRRRTRGQHRAARNLRLRKGRRLRRQRSPRRRRSRRRRLGRRRRRKRRRPRKRHRLRFLASSRACGAGLDRAALHLRRSVHGSLRIPLCRLRHSH